uniref:CSON009505 protein n=1 Tax=Culicoides sonorensis TaxID=179676 RepID=A0A336MYB8_CULSO
MGLLGIFPKFPNCCFCIELRIGCVIIAILGLLNFGGQLYENVRLINSYGARNELVTNAVIYACGVLINVLLLFGAMNRNARWVAIYLYGKIVFIVLLCIGTINNFAHKDTQNGTMTIVTVVLEIYFWLCVNSFYQELGGS